MVCGTVRERERERESGALVGRKRMEARKKALKFVMRLANLKIPRIAIENPIGVLSTLWRKPDQIIQPYQFGHNETKATCLWLKNLPPLQFENPVSMVEVRRRKQRIYNMPPSTDRSKERSKTFKGIATAMANQWT